MFVQDCPARMGTWNLVVVYKLLDFTHPEYIPLPMVLSQVFRFSPRATAYSLTPAVQVFLALFSSGSVSAFFFCFLFFKFPPSSLWLNSKSQEDPSILFPVILLQAFSDFSQLIFSSDSTLVVRFFHSSSYTSSLTLSPLFPWASSRVVKFSWSGLSVLLCTTI